jgi:alpha-aminoadipate carrier protein LysW
MNTVCPECAAQVSADANTEVGEVVACNDCGVDLEVTKVSPLAVAVAPPEEEDWGE